MDFRWQLCSQRCCSGLVVMMVMMRSALNMMVVVHWLRGASLR